MDFYMKELQDKGYTVIPNILTSSETDEALTLFKDWQKTISNHDVIHRKCDSHGIYKHHEIGHQEHSWLLRTHKSVKNVFAAIWKTNDLVVSFDGCCWIPKDFKGKDTFWCHSDQAPNNHGMVCVQGAIGLTDNKERTLVVWEKTHTIHQDYFKILGREKQSNDWQLIPNRHESLLKPLRRVLHIPAGSIALWDSRTFHQNQYGSQNCEERFVQYVCMLPRKHPKNTIEMSKKRRKYFEDRRTTAHWPYPIKVNSLQPTTWGDKSLNIDYSQLQKPNLDRFIDDINDLL